MIREIYVMTSDKRLTIGTVKTFYDSGEKWCLIESPFRMTEVCPAEELFSVLHEINPNYKLL